MARARTESRERIRTVQPESHGLVSRVVMTLGLLASALLSSCALGLQGGSGRDHEGAGVRSDVRSEVLRTSMNELAIDLTAIIELTADRIADEADDPRVRHNALAWKLNGTPAVRQACFRTNPLAALFDAWTLAAQMQEFFLSDAGRDAFGSHQSDAV